MGSTPHIRASAGSEAARGYWTVAASTEGHVVGTFLATTICVLVALAFPHLPRPSFMDWGPHVPFGASMFVFGLALGAGLAVPVALTSLPVALATHWLATRRCGHDDAAHAFAAMLVTAFATSTLFVFDHGLLDVPWSYVLVNVPIGALGGLVHVRILARHARRAEERVREPVRDWRSATIPG